MKIIKKLLLSLLLITAWMLCLVVTNKTPLFAQLLFNKAPTIIPQPKSLEMKKIGRFKLTAKTTIFYDKEVSTSAESLQVVKDFANSFFTDSLKIKEQEASKKKKNSIFFQKKQTDFSANNIKRGAFAQREYYHIKVDKKGVIIIANHAHGFFNAMQTFKQMCGSRSYQQNKKRNIAYRIPFVVIDDYPYLRWRGYMIDVSRHFREKDFILKLIRGLAVTKINILHLHLADNQGYRLQSTKYPSITELSTRGNYTTHKSKMLSMPKQYYTPADIKEMLAYARKHFIEVVPEIDVPGHSTALLRAYPAYRVTTAEGKVRPNVFDIRKPEVVAFLRNLLSEVYEMFEKPAYFHIGGDEVNFKGYALSLEVQTKFIRDMVAYFNQKYDTTIIAWNNHDKPHTDNLFPQKTGAMIQFWNANKSYIATAYQNMEYPIINSLAPHFYLDMKQFAGDFGFTWAIKKTTITNKKSGKKRKVIKEYLSPQYMYENASVYTMKDNIKVGKTQLVGLESPLWSETVKSDDRAEQKTFPRIAITSELAWSVPKEDGGKFVSWSTYRKRLVELLELYDALGITNYLEKKSF